MGKHEERIEPTTAKRERPGMWDVDLPPSDGREGRDALVRAMAGLILEVRTWDGPGELGDSSFAIFETKVAGVTVYTQFLSAPDNASLLCEFPSGYYQDQFKPKDEHRAAMQALGYGDGRSGNFRKELDFDAPDVAEAIAAETLRILGDVFGWEPGTPLKAQLALERKGATGHVWAAIHRADFVELLRRLGWNSSKIQSEDPHVECGVSGLSSNLRLKAPTERYHFAVIEAIAPIGREASYEALNTLNSILPVGRSWLEGEGTAFLQAELDVTGLTEAAVRRWLEQWDLAVFASEAWLRRAKYAREGHAPRLFAGDFTPGGYNVLRMLHCHVREEHRQAALDAFVEHSMAHRETQLDGWAWFLEYGSQHPSAALPMQATYPSGVGAHALEAWLARVHGLQATADGDRMTVTHIVPAGRLELTPSEVRKVEMDPDRLGLIVTSGAPGNEQEVRIAADDFLYPPTACRLELEGASFVLDKSPPLMSWTHTRLRIAALERDMAWAGPWKCGPQLAAVQGGLEGAKRAGIVCEEEEARFAKVVRAATRTLATMTR